MDGGCRCCGFAPLRDEERRGRTGRCRPCSEAMELRRAVEAGRVDTFAAHPSCRLVSLPEATQAQVSVLGRTLAAVGRLRDLDEAQGEAPARASWVAVTRGASMLRALIDGRTLGLDPSPSLGPDASAPDGADTSVLRVVEVDVPPEVVDAWLEQGTFAELSPEVIEATGGYHG